MIHEKCYVYYATENYFEVVKKSIESVRKYSNLPIYVYFLNSELKLHIQNVFTINWNCDISLDPEMYEVYDNKNFYIERRNKNIYNILIQRPLIVKHCLENYSKMVCYVDSDSISTPYVDTIFDYYNDEINYPYFTLGVYDYLFFYGRGGVAIDEEQSNTLEYPLCELLNTNQKNRNSYRQTGYFVSNQKCISFLEEWWETCNHPEVLKNPVHYTPYHEETVANVLLWKYNYQESLPYIYVNGSIERVDEIYNKIKFIGSDNLVSDLYKIPKTKETLLFFHGEKRPNVMEEMIDKIKKNYKMKILFVAPHLSTGGMPSFLLKRIEELLKHNNDIEIFVVEYSYYGPAYVVHRNKIIDLIGKDNFFELGADKDNLINIINDYNIDIVHFDENVEMLNDKLSKNAISKLFDNNRNYRIVETCHNIWFDGNSNKLYHPDGYIFCTPWHQHNTFSDLPSQKITSQFPIENKTPTSEEKLESRKLLGFENNKIHVINVGLWTRGKNQGELVEVAKQMENENIIFHFIGNQAPNFLDYWEPIMGSIPSNVRIWGERNDVDNFLKAADIMSFNSTLECNPLVLREAISYGLKIIARPLGQYMGIYDKYIYPIESNEPKDIVNLLKSVIYNNRKYEKLIYDSKQFSNEHINFYNKILLEKPIMQNLEKSNVQIIKHFVENPFIEIKGDSDSEFLIKFFDENNNLSYQSTLKTNHWSKLNRQYYTKWRTEIYENGNLILNETMDLKDKRVYISFESKSLGDTLSWIPYVEEFRKKNDCKVILSTFLNELLRDQYPEIEFVNPNTTVHNLYALYRIGWFYTPEGKVDTNRHPYDPKSQPLQKTASDILGLEYKEIKPKIKRPYLPKKKKVGIGIHGTTQSKYWNNENGWQEVVNYLKIKGYEVVIYSKENDGYMGNKHPYGATKFKEGPLRELINDMVTCEFFIGIGSGLSWLAWSLDLPVVLISGFSQEWTETKSDTYRVLNKNVCHGCFNMCRLDASDWNWCPMLKDTDRMFECTKSITSEMVIEKIEKIINKTNVVSDFDWGWMNSNDSNSVFHRNAMTYEIFENQIYERLFEVEENDVVVDIGASIGPFTRSIVHKNPKQVYCLEPSESEFKTLVKNTLEFPVIQINKGVTSYNGIIESDQLFGGESHMEGITFETFLSSYNIENIDFLKLDCEGGEYDIFKEEYISFIKNNVKKISGEWHLRSPELKEKFIKFRNEILPHFDNYSVFSIDGVDIKWDLFNQHFIDYYNEVIIYIDNR